MKKLEKVYFILGIGVSLIAAFLMFNGHVLGEDVTGPAMVLGIIGIGLIASGQGAFRKQRDIPQEMK